MKVARGELLEGVRRGLDDLGVLSALRSTAALARMERRLEGVERVFDDKAIQQLINTKHDKSEAEVKAYLVSLLLMDTRDATLLRTRLQWFLPFTPGTGLQTALSLSGGGAKGSFECGALAYLAKLQGILKIAVLSGTSVGAVNSLPIAELGWNGCSKLSRIYLGLSDNRDFFVPTTGLAALSDSVRGATSINLIEELDAIFDTDQPVPASNQTEVLARVLSQTALVPFPFNVSLLSSLAGDVLQHITSFFNSNTGLFSLNPVRNLLRQNVNFATIGQNGIKLFLCGVNNDTGEPCYVNDARKLESIDEFGNPTGFELGQTSPPDDALVDAAIASAAIPIVFEAQPLRMGTMPMSIADFHVDGGLREILPLEIACQPGIDLVIGISASAIDSIPQAPGRPSIPGQIGRFLEVALYDIGKNDKVVPQLKYPDQGFVFLQPDPYLEVHNSFTIDPGLIRINMAYGYMTAYLRTAILTNRWAGLSGDAAAVLACTQLALSLSIIERRKTIHSLEKKAPQPYTPPPSTVLGLNTGSSPTYLFWNVGVVEQIRKHKRELVKEVDAYFTLCSQDPDSLPVTWLTDTGGAAEHISSWWKGWEMHKENVSAFSSKSLWDLLKYNYLGLNAAGGHDALSESPPVSQYFG